MSLNFSQKFWITSKVLNQWGKVKQVLDTIIDTKQAQELSAVIEQTVELVKKDKKELVVVYIIDFNIFESVPASWCDQKFEGWKEIVRVCAG